MSKNSTKSAKKGTKNEKKKGVNFFFVLVEFCLLYTSLQALTEVMDVFIKDMRAKILSDGSNSEGLMSAHRQMVEALREKDESKGLKALKVHFEYIYAYIDG